MNALWLVAVIMLLSIKLCETMTLSSDADLYDLHCEDVKPKVISKYVVEYLNEKLNDMQFLMKQQFEVFTVTIDGKLLEIINLRYVASGFVIASMTLWIFMRSCATELLTVPLISILFGCNLPLLTFYTGIFTVLMEIQFFVEWFVWNKIARSLSQKQ
jgi:hypothetical protein